MSVLYLSTCIKSLAGSLGTNSMLLPVAICNFIKMDGLGRVVAVVTGVSAEQSDNSEVSLFSEQLQISDVKVDDYILVRFTTKSTEKFYIGQMMEMDKKEKEIHTTFMTRMKFHKKGNTFCFPDVEDTGTHRIEDVVFLLPQPKCGTT